MNPSSALDALRRFWWVALALAIVGGVIGAIPEPATTKDANTSYSARYSILISSDDIAGVYNSTVVNQLSTFATTGEVPKRAAAAMGLPDDEGPALAAQVQVAVDVGALVMTINTSQPTRERAVELVDTFGEELVTFIAEWQDTVRTARLDKLLERQQALEDELEDLQDEQLRKPDDKVVQAKIEAATRQYSIVTEQYDTISADTSTIELTPIETGTALENTTDEGLSAPKSRTTRGALGFLVGGLVGVAVAALLSRLDRRIRNRPQAEAVFGAPAAVGIPVVTQAPPVAVVPERHDQLSDSYRTLRSVVSFSQSATPEQGSGAPRARVTLVVSACAGDGKTSVAVNLAAAIAETGKRVVAVNADFRRPSLSTRLLDPAPTPLPYTLETLELAPTRQLLQRSQINGVVVFDLTSVKAAPGHLARATAAALPELIAIADAIVIDTSPVGVTAEVLDLLPFADTVVVVMRLDHTLVGAATRTMELLHSLTTASFHLTVVGDAADGSTYYEYGGTRAKGLRAVLPGKR